MRAPSSRRTRVPPEDLTAPRYRLTDVGNSQRFTDDHADKLIYVPGPGWHVWDGKRWRQDNEGAPYRAAKQTAHRIRREAERVTDPDVAKKVFAWALASESAAKIKSMVDLARRGERTTLGLVRPVELLDAHPFYLTCANGTIDLRTGELWEHRPGDYLTRLVKVRYDPAAKAPRWRKFLSEVFQGDKELAAYVQRAVGYSLSGETREQVFFLPHGVGANGKSVFIETVADAAGEWAATAAGDTFTSSGRGSGIPNDLARLRGVRLVRVPETEEGAALARQIMKRITGNDTIAARFLYREHFEYVPTYKIWLVTNYLPAVPFTDWATWRRIRPIPFARKFEPGEQDKRLRDKLRKELPGVLAWAVEGARLWYQDGLGSPPEAVGRARDAYHARQDTVGRFIEDELEQDWDSYAAKTALYQAYKDWCASEALPPVSRNAFYGSMRERGYRQGKDAAGERVFRGVRLR